MPFPLRTALSVFALSLALPACAQTAPKPSPSPTATDADPALWVVKDADTTIYLFGTVHVLKPGLSWFDEAVKAAFDRSDQLVIEMVTPDPATAQGFVVAKGITTTGPTLTEQLPADKRAAFTKAVTDLGAQAGAFDRMRPWLAGITLTQAPLGKLGYDAANGPETVLTTAAKAAGKPVIGLETFEQQIGFFSSLSTRAQITFLTSTVDELPKLKGEMEEMVDDWAQGAPDKLAALMNDDLQSSPEVTKVLLTDRNARWAGWIAERMKMPGTVFVAVGAGHLAGPDSVQAHLRPLKLTAERVKY